jgi:HEAT repeat protein
MKSPRQRRRRWSLAPLSIVLVYLIGHVSSVNAEAMQFESKSVDALVDDVRKGSFTPATIDRLVKLGAVQATPVLQQQFSVATDVVIKQALASALVRLGRSDAQYWEFLVGRARLAAENDAPFPIAFDTEGKLIPRQLTPDFIAWARAKKLSPEQASYSQVYELPVDLTFLAMTGDGRGLPVLKRALGSRNYFIQAVAAKGLARLQDTSSIPQIIDVCRRAPAQVADLIARALVFFDDARARAASESFITNREILEELRRVRRERGAAGVF